MRTLRILELTCAAALLSLGAWAASGCILENLPDRDKAQWSCKTTADCGGDGFVCVAQSETSDVKFCCRPTPEECDGKDNDCNGKTDDLSEQDCYTGPEGTLGKGICVAGKRACQSGQWGECFGEITPSSRENCNGKDDDCDGLTDEDFDFMSSKETCGNCTTTCNADMWCAGGKCSKTAENCSDGVDNDRNGKADCEDDACLGQQCKASPLSYTCDAQKLCSCNGLVSPPPESTCDDHGDDDCDGLVDCLDPDCQAKSCGVGCVCKELKMTESACDNLRDDDGDGLTDCNDPDCAGVSCGTGCSCDGTKKSETDCTDGVDNDGDFKRDCVDEDCVGKSCSKTGGGTGTCANHVCN